MYRIRLYIVPEQEEPPYETINFPIERSKKHVKNINYDDDDWWLAENKSLSKNKSMSNVTVTHRTDDYKFHDDYWLAENRNLSKDKSLSNAALAAYHATDYNDDWWLTKNKTMCKNKSVSNTSMAYHANDYNEDWWSTKNKNMSKNKSVSNATVAYRTHDYNDDWWMSKNKSMSNVTVTHRTNVGKVNIIFGGAGRRHECKDSGSLYVHKRNHFNKTLGKEYDLEQKIELEIKMREGTTRLLAACKHQAQSLEAARSLLTSTERMSAYMAELQKRKRMPKPTSGLSVQTSCTARVSLSDLRMPLIWRDTDHFKNRGDYRRFAVFCLARIGTEIYDTTLLCPVDRSLTDLTFPDTIIFNKIPADFEFRLEVYSHILQDDLSIASTPRKIKKTIHSSISRTVGKKLAASLKDELNTGKIGPHFELVASAKLMLDDAHDSIHTHDLVTINTENRSHQLPLFGHFCCRLAVQPDCITQEACSGDLSIHDSKGKKWINLWGQLQAFRLDLWEKQEHWEKGKEPVRSIVVDRHTIVQSVKSSPKDLVITNVLEGKEQVTTVRLKNKDELQKWFTCLSLHSQDHLKWKHTAENVMNIESPENVRHSFTRQLRQGSLYDETPLIETTHSDYNHRPTVQDIFGLTPSTSLSSCASSSSSPTFRERSFSSGGSSKSRLGTGTLRSHWPFNSKD